jgi:transposase-like protein
MCMQINCPRSPCISNLNTSPRDRLIVSYGFYFRKSDSRKIRRFYCKTCKTHFSASTFKSTYRQKKRRLSVLLSELFCSGVSQRRAAKILGVNRKTIVRRFRYLAKEARLKQERFLDQYKMSPLPLIQFDDLETSEHTKCKPLSVALAVDPKTRKILNFQVNQMPAKGLLAGRAVVKYGYRRDERELGWDQLMKALQPIVAKNAIFASDENPHYPKFILKYYPKASHFKVLGGRGAITGQGELKKLRFDPLFSLNHTCAMLRANLNRLFRKTWCTTKNKQGLIDHLSLYVIYHNQKLTGSTV